MPELLKVLEKGREDEWYAFIWMEEVLSRSVTIGKIENVAESTDRGMVFRIQQGGRVFERSTNRLDRESLFKLAELFRDEVERAAAVSGGAFPAYRPLSWEEEIKIPLGNEFISQIPESANESSWIHFSPNCVYNPFDTDVGDLAEKARALRQKVSERSGEYIQTENTNLPEKALAPLSEIRVHMRQNIKTHIFVDRMKNMSQSLPVSLAYPMGISSTGHVGRAIAGGLGGLEIADISEEDLDLAAILPLRLSRASRIQPGRYKVITGPDVTGVIAHEAFGHTQEGDTWMKGRSISVDLREKGIKVGNDQASIVNYAAVFSMDELSHGSNGSYFFDHEGQLSRPQVILDKGMLSKPMADLTVSVRMNVPRTANGKRESWRRPLMTRQTNTYFTPGDKTLDELIAMVDNGYLARYAHGGMEDPKGGSLTAGAEYFEEIKNGKLTGQIYLGPSGGHIELSDPVFTLLDRIIAKTSSVHPEGIPENKFGGCGKYHKESVEAGCGGPYILWESVNCG